MAVWKEKVAGCEVKILNVDHMPPHCHIAMPAKELKVDLHTLEVINPPPHELPPALRRGLVKRRESLLEAWDRVRIIPSGGNPGSW